MKNIKFLMKFFLLIGLFTISSCDEETTNLDLSENPNALTPEQASPDFLLNSIQVEFVKTFEKFQTTAGEVTRLYYMNGKDYSNAYGSTTFDVRWRNAYADMFTDIKAMNEITGQNGMTHHEAIAQILQAYMLTILVDNFGDVPYSEILQGADNLNPKVDDGQSVYEVAFSLLDSAIDKFNQTASAEPENDFYYNGDWTKWMKLANTLKMQMYINTRLVDSDAIDEFNTIVASGNYISSNTDDFQFRWGLNVSQPDTRHPRYKDNYTSTGGDEYMSNSLMYYMRGLDAGAYSSPDHFDPRILFYFYRQSSATPGIAGEPVDEDKLECALIPAPAHYTDYVYCGIAKGWWGRDHGNDKGVPPDNFDRTLAGVYPCGGKLDDLDYTAQSNGDGNGGNGITPLMLATWSKFMIAEAKMSANDDIGAKAALLEGMDLSWDKVYNFYPVSSRFDMIFDGSPFPPIQSYYDDFKTEIDTDWTTASTTEKWNIIANQYWVASYGNGLNTYNFYRRTGFPNTLQPNLEPNPGKFIRSFYYPSNYVTNNSNANQKSDVGVQVFWDDNAASPSFPQSN